jgi:Fe-S-cluster containining protein
MPWTCAQTGDCCTVPVVMTPAEARGLVAATSTELHWRIGPGDKVSLVRTDTDATCPLLGPDRRCTVYAARPYNCRRFACLRDQGEALVPGGPLGCQNAERRMGDRQARRQVIQIQRKAQVWARKHGWTDDAF